MAMTGRLIERLLKRGEITVVTADGKRTKYGPGGGKSVTIRFTDRKVPFELLRNPRLGLGEAYMDGRIIIENGTALDLLELIMSSNPWEEGKQARGLLNRGKERLGYYFTTNNKKRAKKKTGAGAPAKKKTQTEN